MNNVCLCCGRGYLMTGLDAPPLRDCAVKQRVAMVTVKGEGGGCVCVVVLEVARWTLAGRMAGEREMRSVVLCHSCCSPSLCCPSLPVSRIALMLSSWSEWEAERRTNTESQWDSWEETHFPTLFLSDCAFILHLQKNTKMISFQVYKCEYFSIAFDFYDCWLGQNKTFQVAYWASGNDQHFSPFINTLLTKWLFNGLRK